MTSHSSQPAPGVTSAASSPTRTLRIAVVQAGLSSPSTTSRLADLFTKELVSAIEGGGTRAEVTRIDLRPLAVGLMESTVSIVKTQPVADALAAIDAADLLIAVSPTFKASYSGLFKAFFDLVEPKALAGVPVILGATGGTARHSLVVDLAMRPLFTYLRAMPVPTSVFASSDDFAGPSSLAGRARLAAQEALVLLGVDASRAPAGPGEAPVGADAAAGASADAGAGSAPAGGSRRSVTGSSQAEGGSESQGLSSLGGRTSAADDFTDFVPFDQLLGAIGQGK